MYNGDVFCCYDKNTCSSYKNDDSVCFKHIKSAGGIISDGWKSDGIQWIFVLSGTLEVKTKDKEITLEAGNMFLLPVEKYAVISIEESELIFFTSDRPTEYCVTMLAELFENVREVEERFVKLKIVNPLDKFLSLLMVYMDSGVDCKYLFEGKQHELFMVIRACYTEEELVSFLYPLTLRKDSDQRKLIIDNCSKAKNIQELATLCGYSVGGFKRLFKEIFNEPVYRWMQQQKVNSLKIRLREKDVNLKELIDEYGFSSPAHFTKFCKQWLGMVPTQYIKKQQKEIEF